MPASGVWVYRQRYGLYRERERNTLQREISSVFSVFDPHFCFIQQISTNPDIFLTFTTKLTNQIPVIHPELPLRHQFQVYNSLEYVSNFSQNVYGGEPKKPPFLTDPKISPFPTPKTTDYLWVVADFAAHSRFTVMASNPKNKPRASREVEKPSIEPILPPMVEEMCGQDIWNNCAVCSVVSGVMGATSSLSPSFGKCGGEGGPIAYTLSPSLPLKGLKTADPPSPFCERTSVCLVHLGGRDFCFVETGQSEYLADIQHIGVTTFEIVDDGEEGNPMINTLHSTVYAVDTSDLQTFDIDFGFATWLDDVEPEGEIMTLLIEQEETEWKETSLEELNWGVADACQLTKGEGEVKKKSGQGKGKKKSRSGK